MSFVASIIVAPASSPRLWAIFVLALLGSCGHLAEPVAATAKQPPAKTLPSPVSPMTAPPSKITSPAPGTTYQPKCGAPGGAPFIDPETRPRQFPVDARFAEFRTLIEGYVVGVRPGLPLALRDAAGDYAAYLADFHCRLHMQFVPNFVDMWPPEGKADDPTLKAKVEIVLEPDGSLNRVGIVKTSGDLSCDFGVFNVVRRGAPYPVPPASIRSFDGRVYIRWTLNRGESQCGTWNAEPCILAPPTSSQSQHEK